jgi:hypothetical protein
VHTVFLNSSPALELGGKDPAYVAPDANIDGAAEGLVDGAFYNAGQVFIVIYQTLTVVVLLWY